MEIIKHGQFDEKISKTALDMLLVDRKNEFRELADVIGIPRDVQGWETVILKFCLDLDDCFKDWSDEQWDLDHNTIHKSMTLIRQLAKGRSTMNDLVHLLNIGYTLAQEFKAVYERFS